jgi:hypothetical protein
MAAQLHPAFRPSPRERPLFPEFCDLNHMTLCRTLATIDEWEQPSP